MRFLLALPMVLLICTSEVVIACGGRGGSGPSFSSRSSSGGFPSAGAFVSPVATPFAKMNMARQASIVQANAYNARMRPVRVANANRARQEKIAERQARTEIRIAKREAKVREQQEFLANARSWTDSTGTYEVTAILAEANSWGVRLQKSDGSFVSVPYKRLSTPDQAWVASQRADGTDVREMFASL